MSMQNTTLTQGIEVENYNQSTYQLPTNLIDLDSCYYTSIIDKYLLWKRLSNHKIPRNIQVQKKESDDLEPLIYGLRLLFNKY